MKPLEALRLILPMARGYAADHPVGSNQRYIEEAEACLEPDFESLREQFEAAWKLKFGTIGAFETVAAYKKECLFSYTSPHVQSGWEWYQEGVRSSPPSSSMDEVIDCIREYCSCVQESCRPLGSLGSFSREEAARLELINAIERLP